MYNIGGILFWLIYEKLHIFPISLYSYNFGRFGVITITTSLLTSSNKVEIHSIKHNKTNLKQHSIVNSLWPETGSVRTE